MTAAGSSSRALWRRHVVGNAPASREKLTPVPHGATTAFCGAVAAFLVSMSVIALAGCSSALGSPSTSEVVAAASTPSAPMLIVSAGDIAACADPSMRERVDAARASSDESPDNSPLLPPQLLAEKGYSDAAVRQQADAWSRLSDADRAFQICLNHAEGNL